MIEVEIKYIVDSPAYINEKLRALASSEGTCVAYEDIYFDNSSALLAGSDRELRIRQIISKSHVTKIVLTAKGARLDDATQSKEEHEVEISDLNEGINVLALLDFSQRLRFTKEIRNYDLIWKGYKVLASVVFVPELSRNFLEIEVLVENNSEWDAVRNVLHSLGTAIGLDESNITNEYYTDAIKALRQKI